jgi:ATP-binding cassette subfamily B protein
MNTSPEPSPEHPKVMGKLNTFEFKNISFGYKSATTQALSNISYKAEKGQTIAFVGPSGSGKTSLVKLLVGLYVPT